MDRSKPPFFFLLPLLLPIRFRRRRRSSPRRHSALHQCVRTCFHQSQLSMFIEKICGKLLQKMDRSRFDWGKSNNMFVSTTPEYILLIFVIAYKSDKDYSCQAVLRGRAGSRSVSIHFAPSSPAEVSHAAARD